MNSMAVKDDAIVQEIVIRGSAQRVFDALTRPEELVKWWGVTGKFQLIGVESDLQPGGKWRFAVSARGGTSVVSGEYREIKRPYLLVYTWVREEDAAETVVRWELEEQSGVTRVRVTHSGLATESLRVRNNGWPMIVGLLQAYVEGRNGN